MATLTRLHYAAIAIIWTLCGQVALAKSFQFVTSVSLDPDKAPGFEVEVIRQVFTAMGQSVSFEFVPAKRAFMMIKRGERDGMSSVQRTKEREQICTFPSEPVSHTRTVLFIRTGDIGKLKFSSFDALAGHDVAVNTSYLPGSPEHPDLPPKLESFLREHHNMVETPGAADSLRMLAAGRVDYAAMDILLGKLIIRKGGLSGKVEPLLSRSLIERDAGACFAKGRVSPAFVSAFSRALKQFKQTGAFRAIQHKYRL